MAIGRYSRAPPIKNESMGKKWKEDMDEEIKTPNCFRWDMRDVG